MDTTNLNSKEGFGLAYKVSLLLILTIVAFYLVEEHRAHLIAYSGTIFFIAFILLHLFMHSGHGGHGGGCCGHGENDEVHHEHNKRGKEHETGNAGEPQDARQDDHGQKEDKL
jgi:Protein of unknown function (DUF2933)